MKKKMNFVCVALSMVLVVSVVANANVVDDVATRLVNAQEVDGSWAEAGGLNTGAIVAGLVHAYEVTGNASYLASAEAGGSYIISAGAARGVTPNYYGDEGHALARLSQVSSSGTYGAAAGAFYESIDPISYISQYSSVDPSAAVYYLGYHTVASDIMSSTYATNFRDALWDVGVRQFLATVNDGSAVAPVQSLAIATWAFSQTGSLDNTEYIDPFGMIGPDWQGITKADLPGMLAGHQIVGGDLDGAFYWKLDHSSIGGFTDDTLYGLMGLEGAMDIDGVLYSYADEVAAAFDILTMYIGSDGIVPEHTAGGAEDYLYAGHLLQVIPEPATMLLLGIGGLLAARRKRS